MDCDARAYLILCFQKSWQKLTNKSKQLFNKTTLYLVRTSKALAVTSNSGCFQQHKSLKCPHAQITLETLNLTVFWQIIGKEMTVSVAAVAAGAAGAAAAAAAVVVVVVNTKQRPLAC